MIWNRSETLALAAPACNLCLGLGICLGRHGATRPCNCVLRAIFRSCFDKYRETANREKYLSRVTFQGAHGKSTKGTWGRKDEEYSADFYLVSKRTLSEEEFEIFRLHFIQGLDWKACLKRLPAFDRGNFFHAVYRIEQKLGRVFRELEPYALFPVDEYFHGPAKDVSSCLAEAAAKPKLGRVKTFDRAPAAIFVGLPPEAEEQPGCHDDCVIAAVTGLRAMVSSAAD